MDIATNTLADMERPSPGESFRLDASGTCTRCERRIAGWIAIGSGDLTNPTAGPSIIVDSGGFMVFAEGIVCDRCLGEATA